MSLLKYYYNDLCIAIGRLCVSVKRIFKNENIITNRIYVIINELNNMITHL